MKPNSRRAAGILIYLMSLGGLILLMLLVLKSFLPGLMTAVRIGDRAELEAYLASFGTWRGRAVALLMQFMQILSVLFPGGPVQLAVGAVFGFGEGFLLLFFGYVSASFLVFLAAHRLKAFLPGVTGKTKLGQKLNLVRNAKNPAATIFLFSILPFLPNGLIPYAAAGTAISPLAFLGAVGVGCLPALAFLAGTGAALANGNAALSLILAAAYAVLLLILFRLRKRIAARLARIKDRRFPAIRQ